MLDRFSKFISENKLIKENQKILLAVSGGIDSMVMAHLFLRSGIKTGIAHCNFSLRGDESDMDEKLVRDYAAKNNIPFHSKSFDTKSYAEANKLSVQMAARELRYAWFEEIRNEYKYDLVSVAHNLNDNIETLLINLTRGTGIAGLTGISVRHNFIIRPLLFATRNEIMSYCSAHGVIYREDRTNAETKYIRNKIRHKIMPVLKEINPAIEYTLAETAERISEISSILSEHISEITSKVSHQKDGTTIFDVNLLKDFRHNKTVIYELFKPFGVTGVMIPDLIKIIDGRTGSQVMSPTHRIIKNRMQMIVTPLHEGEDTLYEIDSLEDFRKVPEIKSASYFNISTGYMIPSNSRFACLDTERIKFPVTIRKWKAGDYFYPFGMGKRKKLSDYFIDKKYPLTEKEKKLVLLSGDEIVWVIGERIDDRFRITDKTKTVLVLESQ
jgi:tRNA(Ile)-lysidine synthase